MVLLEVLFYGICYDIVLKWTYDSMIRTNNDKEWLSWDIT